MSDKKEIYVVSTSEEYWSSEDYSSKEEALKSGPDDLGLSDGEPFFVGVKEEPIVNYPDEDFVDQYLENMRDRNEEIFGEWAETWVDKVNGSEEIKEFFKLKMEEIGNFIQEKYKPTFYMVNNFEQVYTPENKK